MTDVIFDASENQDEQSSVRDTSMKAFLRKLEDGSLESDRAQVYRLIRDLGPLTSKDLSVMLGKSKNQFSGRITKLQELGLVESVGVEDNHNLWQVTEQ